MRQLESDQQNFLEHPPLMQQQILSKDENKQQKIRCVFCGMGTFLELLDLGAQPFANRLLSHKSDSFLSVPLTLVKCKSCGHYQRLCNDLVSFDSDYPYRTSINHGYLKQCERWIEKETLFKKNDRILEIGCNDGSLIGLFRKHGFVNSVGIDPCAPDAGMFIKLEFEKAHFVHRYDWIIANNVIAHVPDLKSVLEKIRGLLSSNGIFSCEVPLFERLVEQLSFDTIYHEHYSYFTKNSLCEMAEECGLFPFKIEEIPSHGGSARFYFRKMVDPHWDIYAAPDLRNFKERVLHSKRLWVQRIHRKAMTSQLALFGAAAKGITWLNYCGFSQSEFQYCVDETPEKQGKWIPGARIPIVGMDFLLAAPPHVLYILPWNFGEEIKRKLRKFSELKNTKIVIVRK